MPPTPAQRLLPNLLTTLRVFLAAALFVLLAAWPGPPRPAPDPLLLAAAAVFILAALTDFLDGHLARKWKVVSVFGRIMDPFADKILVVGAFVFLAGPAFSVPAGLASSAASGAPATSPPPAALGPRVQVSGIAVWMAAVILARELLVTSIRAVAESAGIDFSAGASGKLKMILQSLAIPAILLILALAGPVTHGPARVAILTTAWIAVAITAWSAIPYLSRARKLLVTNAENA